MKLLKKWGDGVMGNWSKGESVYWSIGVLEYWGVGIGGVTVHANAERQTPNEFPLDLADAIENHSH